MAEDEDLGVCEGREEGEKKLEKWEPATLGRCRMTLALSVNTALILAHTDCAYRLVLPQSPLPV